MFAFTRFTLSRQFALVSFLILLIGMIGMGSWVGLQIEQSVTNRTAAVTALYVDSYISIYLQELATGDQISQANLDALERILTTGLLGQQVVSFRVWSTDGRIIYSPTPELIGRQYPLEEDLQRSLAGEVTTELTQLDEEENAYERQYWSELIEIYAPVRASGSGEIIASSEFYQLPDALEAEIRSAQYRSWLVVAGATLGLYALLAGMVDRASRTITAQHSELQESLDKTRTLLAQNEELNERVQGAAARTIALNERYLRRISADLHDGPAQDLALAMLRLDSVIESWPDCPPSVTQDFSTVRTAVESSLNELRTISAGLRMPEMKTISPAETIGRAVRDYEQKFNAQVKVQLGKLPDHASLPVKITLYRVIKEALTNSFHHASGSKQAVSAAIQTGDLSIEISDDGQGFDPTPILSEPAADGHLGLVGMRERVKVLGGRFDVISEPGRGTAVRVTLPLTIPEVDDV